METQTVQNGNRINLNHEEIAAKAYQLWEASGYQTGFEVKNWLQAEQDLREAASPGTAGNPRPTEQKPTEAQRTQAKKASSVSRNRSNTGGERALAH